MRNIFKKKYEVNNSSLVEDLAEYNTIKPVGAYVPDTAQTKLDEDKKKWLQKQKDKRLEAETEMEADYPLKTYHLEVISGGVAIPYVIDARGYDWGSSGSSYWFYTYKIDGHLCRVREVLAHFPIHKTIIKKIELTKY